MAGFGFAGRRSFYKWINTIFNKVDNHRIKEVGPDRAAAEWLLRCGASVKWKDQKCWVSDYNSLEVNTKLQHVIEDIDATESCIMNEGFHYFNGLNNLRKIKFRRCIYLDDTCIHKLTETDVKNSLQHLEIISCGNITDNGVLGVTKFKNLKKLHLFDLPEVNRECLCVLIKSLPDCDIDFPEKKSSNDV
ncbi:ATP synthase subunit s, mitochondrial [Parasteatoda tepidariorum]|uniref:ATP synthase subunit s, mitochondrial n=1 Tax=Parasteatoda tepidariorum TaxID=114398 RepID=UPI00077F98D0|nr:ATP synthase subunit s, mitochondrial [Parasteatoda tepidariorum]